jgi:hypothetical protein
MELESRQFCMMKIEFPIILGDPYATMLGAVGKLMSRETYDSVAKINREQRLDILRAAIDIYSKEAAHE